MVTIRKRTMGKQTYYYLEHTIRKEGKIEKREHYLGKQLPKNIEDLKKEFLSQLYQERWYPVLNKIKQAFTQEVKHTPISAQEEEIEKFAIHFTYDTQRIEGSKLSLRETADLLERGITPKAKPIRDVKEAEAHKALFDEMLKTKKDISYPLVLYWHKKLLRDTKPDIAGKIREHQVAISGSKFLPPHPVEVYPLLQEFFKWYDKSKAMLHPMVLAALVHLKFVTIHPFGDGNGRISRLLMNFVLHRKNYPLLNIHYEGRAGYYTALERAQTKQMEFIFIQWFIKKYIKEQKHFLKNYKLNPHSKDSP
ncbi:Fic family protein [Candidatus Woesearchaeota archaeon]|nr:Fic family protein [Candidatus Woesearchaeota archaeon]